MSGGEGQSPTPAGAITGLLWRTASGNAGVRGLAMGLGLLVSLAISRNSEVAVFGQYFWLLAVVELSGRVAGLGFNASLTRYLATYASEGKWGDALGILRFALALVPAAGLLVGVIVMAGIGLWDGFDLSHLGGLALAALLALFVLYPIMQVLLGALQGLKQPVRGNAGQGLVRPLVLLAGLGVIIFSGGGLGVANLLAVTAAAVAVSVLAMYLWTRRGMTAAAPTYRPRLWLRTSLPMLFAALTWLLLQRIDIVMLATLADFHDTGLYVAATRLANLVSIGLILVGGIVAPLIAEFYAGGRTADLQRLVAQAAAGCTVLAVAATLVMLVAGEWLLGLFGAEYRAAYPALMILSAGHLLLALFGTVRALATMTKYEDLRAVIGIATVALNVVLNFLLIPKYGLDGAAAATSVSLLFSSLTLYAITRKRLKVDSTILGLWRRHGL